jgi:regulatory protein YycI of two-component signal transduction system YycFG
MKKNNKNILIIFLLLITILLWSKLNNLSETNDELEESVSNYEEALDQANENIEDAQSYRGGSYEDMDYALYNLETVEVQ